MRPAETLTFCITCKHAILPNGEKTPAFYWLCAQAKIGARWNYVTGEREAPYDKCKYRNDGDCPMWEPGPNRARPKPMPEEE